MAEHIVTLQFAGEQQGKANRKESLCLSVSYLPRRQTI